MIPPDQREVYEAQATACLEAAATYREPLLRVALRLTGNEEAARELLNQTALDCHDAIQSKGFEGNEYRFYLLRSMRNGYRRQQKAQLKQVPFDLHHIEQVEFEELPSEAGPGVRRFRQRVLSGLTHAGALPEADQVSHLAEQVEAALRDSFKPADRVAFRLHVAGYACQDIAEMVGRRDRTWVWRRIERMKRVLREKFRSAWESLDS